MTDPLVTSFFSMFTDAYVKAAREQTIQAAIEQEAKRQEQLSPQQRQTEMMKKQDAIRREEWATALNQWSHIRCSYFQSRQDRQRIEIHLASRITSDFPFTSTQEIQSDLENIYNQPSCGLRTQMQKIRAFLARHL